MYHSVTFGSMNSFSDWHLVPDSRPVIVMPEPKIVTVEVPGGNGLLDLSETLTKYPIYNNREGSLKFHVLNNKEPWQVLYHKIANYLHGKKMTMILEDDPDYYYYGRFKVTWTSNNDGTWSDVEIAYTLDPYKYSITTSIQEDSDLYESISVNNTTIIKTLDGDRTLGNVPVIPEFIVSDIRNTGLKISLTNVELGIYELSKTLNTNRTAKFYDMILSNMNGKNKISLKFSGYGKADVVFRRMSL